MNRLLVLILIGCIFSNSAAFAREQNQVALETVAQKVTETPKFGLRGQAAPMLSPDGQWVAFGVVRPSLEQDSNLLEVVLKPVASEANEAARTIASLSDSDGSISELQWSDDSNFLLWQQHTNEPDARSDLPVPGNGLVMYDVNNGSAESFDNLDDYSAPNITPAVTAVANRGAKLSPSGRYIAFAAAVTERSQGDDIETYFISLNEGGPTGGGIYDYRPNYGLFVLDRYSKKLEQVTPDDFNVRFGSVASWSPDERHLVVETVTTPEGMPILRTNLAIVDRIDKSITPLVSRPGRDGKPRWSPDGHSIAFQHDRRGGDGSQLAVVSAKGGNVTDYSIDLAMEGWDEFWWSSDGQSIYFTAPDGFDGGFFRLDIKSGKVLQIPNPTAGHGVQNNAVVSFAPTADTIAFIRESIVSPQELFTATLTEGSKISQSVSHINLAPEMRYSERVRLRAVSWRSRDDRFDLQGLLLTPNDSKSDRDAKKPMPTLVVIKGGPQGQIRNEFSTAGADIALLSMALRGYAVLYPVHRGRMGFGRELHQGMVEGNSPYELSYQDVMAGVDYLVDEKLADPNKLGIFGHSYGGGLASYAVTQTSRFQAAVNYEGGHGNWIKKFTESARGSDWDIKMRALYGSHDLSDPEDRERLIEQSPMFHAHRVRTPTMMAYGMRGMLGRLEIFYALRDAGAPVVYGEYDDLHVFFKPSNVNELIVRIGEWFDHWMLGLDYPNAHRAAEYNDFENRFNPEGR